MAFFSVAGLDREQGEYFPELKRFADQTRQAAGPGFWIVEEPFAELCRSDFLEKFFSMEVRRISQNYGYDALNRDDEIEILETPDFKLSIGKQSGPQSWMAEQRNEMVCYARDFITCNLGPGTLELQLYEPPAGQQNELFDLRNKAVPTTKRVLRPGDLISARAGKDIIRLVDATGEVNQIHCVSTFLSRSLVWHYDVESLSPKYCTSGSTTSSRLEIAVGVLARLGGQQALPAIMSLYEYGDHFVRWTALRTAVAISENQCLGLLKRATKDNHPHVRSAATQVLRGIHEEDLNAR